MSGILRTVGFCLIIVMSVGFAGFVATHSPQAPTTSPAAEIAASTTEPADPVPTVGLFVGDTYTTGTGSGDSLTTFAGLTCGRLGWVCYYDAQRASGYLSTGGSSSLDFGSYPQRLKSDRVYLPDVVVVSGGRADLGLGDVKPVAERYFRAIRKQYPKAKVFVLEPFWMDETPPSEVVTLQSQVQEAAQGAGVNWVPTGGWLTEALIGPDKINPSDKGQSEMAAKLVSSLDESLN